MKPRGWGDYLVMGRVSLADLADLVEYRLVDGRPTAWNRTVHADPNPFPRLRLFGR